MTKYLTHTTKLDSIQSIRAQKYRNAEHRFCTRDKLKTKQNDINSTTTMRLKVEQRTIELSSLQHTHIDNKATNYSKRNWTTQCTIQTYTAITLTMKFSQCKRKPIARNYFISSVCLLTKL